MTLIQKLTLLLAFLFTLCSVQADAQVKLSPEEAEKLVIEKYDPLYPPIAKAVRAEGVVSVEVVVSERGRVTAAKVTNGHPLLREAAGNSVKRRKYKPYLVNGRPVPFTTTVDISFPPGTSGTLTEAQRKENERQDQLASLYFKHDDKCRNLVRAQKWKEAEETCKALVGIADQLTDDRSLEKMGAYESFGLVMMGQSHYREALDYYSRALNAVRVTLNETNAELGSLFGNMAMAHHALRDLDKAREMYRKAERVYQLAYASIGGGNTSSETHQIQQQYMKRLKQLLEYHLIAAQQAGATDEVEEIKKLKEKLP